VEFGKMPEAPGVDCTGFFFPRWGKLSRQAGPSGEGTGAKEQGMNKKHNILISSAVLLLAVMFMAAGCDSSGGGDTATYTGNAGGTQYRLTITANSAKAAYIPKSGDSYVLVIGTQRSEGKVIIISGGFSLTPDGETVPFTVAVKGNGITAIDGDIKLVGGGTVKGPITMTPGSVENTDDGTTPTSLTGTTWEWSGETDREGYVTLTLAFKTATTGIYNKTGQAAENFTYTYTYDSPITYGSMTFPSDEDDDTGLIYFVMNGDTLILDSLDFKQKK
jgi:hypothetical protein